MIVTQQSAQTLPTPDFSDSNPHLLTRFDQTILQSLVISFAMKMPNELSHGSSQHALAKEYQTIGTLLLQTAPKTLQVRIQIRRLWRQTDRLRSRSCSRANGERDHLFAFGCCLRFKI